MTHAELTLILRKIEEMRALLALILEEMRNKNAAK